jgi:hypothetical protein
MTTNVPQDVESLILGADDLISRREAITSIDEYAKRWNGEIVDPVTIRRILKELRAQRQQGAEPVPIYQYTENELGGGFVQWNDCKESTMKAMAEKGISTRIVYTTPPQANALVAAAYRKAADEIESLRTQLADATRKLEEARKDAERWQMVETLMILGNVSLVQDEEGGYSIDVEPVDNLLLPTWKGNTPAEAIDQAIEQGKGGDDETV